MSWEGQLKVPYLQGSIPITPFNDDFLIVNNNFMNHLFCQGQFYHGRIVHNSKWWMKKGVGGVKSYLSN